MMKPRAIHCSLPVGLLLAVAIYVWASAPGDDLHVTYGEPIELAVLDDERINESSGLARSYTRPGTFWTHNDSGDDARLFWIDDKGKTLATYDIAKAETLDWEDMCSFQMDGVSYLLIGDIGDNGARRRSLQLYIVREPNPAEKSDRDKLKIHRKIVFTFETGPIDCESLAFDVTTNTILLVSKRIGLTSTVFELPLPADDNDKPLVAKPIAAISVLAPTAMDISADGQRAVVLTYGNGYEYVRAKQETWQDAFSRKPHTIRLPSRRQGEAICYGADDKTLYLTSERESQPFWQVPAAAPK